MFRRFYSIQYGDTVLIRSLKRGDKFWLSQPLVKGGQIGITKGFINHDDLIGVKSRSLIKSNKEDNYIVTEASTEDYINLVKRQAQPIYPLDAASIVTLADLHVDYPELDSENKLVGDEIHLLEAGTSHGSLTLAICNKIHAANCFYEKFGVRGALLHSIDNNETHLRVGSRNLVGFKRGIYKNDVEFHLSESPAQWLKTCGKEEEFLDAAFLDMADLIPNIKTISENLKQDAPLIIFTPSITQIIDVLKHVKDDLEIKLTNIKTIQLMPGIGGGLQEWDVRFTKIRANDEDGIVCRPKVGSRVVGGGFVSVFKKLPKDSIRSK